MTIYFAPPGEPFDGDNWQEISEAIVEFEPEIKGMSEQKLFVSRGATRQFEFEPSPEFVNAAFGYDVYALNATVSEWLARPVPMPSIPKAELIELQDGINRMHFHLTQATQRFALGGPQ